MNNIIKIYLDYGSGYVLTSPSYVGKLSNINDINPLIFRKKVELTCVFFGQDYVNILNEIVYNYKKTLPFKVELYEIASGSFITFAEGDANIRDAVDYDKKIITVRNFVVNDDYVALLKVIDSGVNVSRYRGEKSRLFFNNYPFNHYSIPTPVIESQFTNFGEYQIAFNPDGTLLADPPNPDWELYTFVSKTTYTVDGTVFAEYLARSNRFLVSTNGFEVKTLFNGETVVLGSDAYVDELTNPYYINITRDYVSVTLTQAFEMLLSENNLTDYTVEPLNAFASYYLTDITLLSTSGEQKTFGQRLISLSDLFNVLEKMFNIFWYIESKTLKFRQITDIQAQTELFNAETVRHLNFNSNQQRVTFLDSRKPDFETFQTEFAASPFFDKLTISYNIETGVKEQNALRVVTDAQNVLSNPNSDAFLFASTGSTTGKEIQSITTPSGVKSLNYTFSWPNLLSLTIDNYRPFDNGTTNITTGEQAFNLIIRPPFYSSVLQTVMIDEFNSTFENKYVATGMGFGIVKNASLDVVSSIITWDLEYNNITLYLLDESGNKILDEAGIPILVS